MFKLIIPYVITSPTGLSLLFRLLNDAEIHVLNNVCLCCKWYCMLAHSLAFNRLTLFL